LNCFVCLCLIDDEDEYDTFTIDNDEKVSTADPSNIKSSSIDEADADENDDADSEISEAEKWPPENGEIPVKVVPTTKRKIQKRFQNKYVNNNTWIAKFKLLY